MMNDRHPFGAFRVRTRKLPAWQIALIGAVAAALVITLAVVATGVFLVAFPAILILDQVYRWRARKAKASAVQPRPGQPVVIDAEYEVLPPERPRQNL
ncbi:hypothetical protein [Terrihabitans rhizophilus]|jgi:hypothetical protein|uniref:Uncharacterized protein n=1 Tax=Terrihabitans rhizophilus TaxID=3092662 RepID=A0ABU4RRI3_9HYPH|nr:hypothetical protein [Terrihabitans sp. PJ23]MDX6806788.1 hypothetical protein [Terrihabitans sp. PJ23]